MAHELRNPLVAIRTFTQLMKHRYEDPEFKEFFFTTVSEEVEKLNTLIEKLMAFGHPIEYKFDIIDLGEVLDQGLQEAIKDFPLEKYRIIKEYSKDMVKVRGDFSQLSRALSYIFHNSFSAMPEGGTLTIHTELMLPEQNVKVSIRDTGKGISEEDLAQVFDPFYTAPDKGIGLGLPISQKIIEDHGGKVSIQSKLNEGSTISVILPFQKVEE